MEPRQGDRDAPVLPGSEPEWLALGVWPACMPLHLCTRVGVHPAACRPVAGGCRNVLLFGATLLGWLVLQPQQSAGWHQLQARRQAVIKSFALACSALSGSSWLLSCSVLACCRPAVHACLQVARRA